jgi:hypothetical protein
MTDRLNYVCIANLIDSAYRIGVTIDGTLAVDGRAGRLDDARKASLAALEQLGHLRAALHREAVAAGGDAATAFVRRDLRPALETKIAAAQAQQEQRAHELAAQVERERRSAVHGRRGWAAREASEP